MNFTKHDLKHLRRSGSALLASLLAGGIFTWQGTDYLERSKSSLLQAQQQLETAQMKLKSTRNDFSNMQVFADEYHALLERGMIGSEQRLAWVETLATLHTQQRVSDFKYTLSAPQAYTSGIAIENKFFGLKLSQLHLQMGLLHEMQLLDFFSALQNENNGWFIIDSCTIARLPTASETGNQSVQLNASCDAGWLTLEKLVKP